MTDIVNEICNILGIDPKDIMNYTKDLNSSLKVKENGKTIVDIENGEDKLKKNVSNPEASNPIVGKSITGIPDEGVTQSENKNVSFTSNNSLDTCNGDTKKPVAKPYVPPKTTLDDIITGATHPVYLGKGVFMVKDNLFYITPFSECTYTFSEKSPLVIRFNNNENGIGEGVHNDQLLNILLYRYKDNPDKYELVKKLMQ